MEILIIIMCIIILIPCIKQIRKNRRANSVEGIRAQFNLPKSTPNNTEKLSIEDAKVAYYKKKDNDNHTNDTNCGEFNDTAFNEDDNNFIDDMYEDVKQNPDKKESWYGLSEEEMEEIYYRLKKDKIYLSDTIYKYISNIIGGEYEDDLIDELQYVDEFSISEWIDEKRRDKLFLSSKVWRKIKSIQRKNY